MFEPEELRWGVYEIFSSFEGIDYVPRRSFLRLAPEVRVEDFLKEVARCRAKFAPFFRSQGSKRVRTVYLRQWRRKNRERWNAYRREWRAGKKAA